ncbi:MAG: hypothetical protein LQ339_005204 [Xanthoria mediterranea]|nr:MAG: hypothetical protein LQ339_005204 [Xanthoria mediterranea]
MAFSEDVPIPQGRDLQRRVNNAISDETGHLEEPRLDLDARSMAILGKRQQLSVRRELQRKVGIQTYRCIAMPEELWPGLSGGLLDYVNCVLGVNCMVGYEPLNWHATMLYWMVLLIAMIVNILGIRVFPHIESAAFIFHICFFFVLLVPLVYLTPQSSAQFVFADFENAGGWESNGEEVKDAANVVPQSMVIALIISGVLTMAFSIAILFGIGDIHLALQTPTHYPIIQIFYTATGSKGATTAITCTLILTLVSTTFGLLACASRLAWAFARDKGFPFPNYFAHVSYTALL